MHSVPTQGALLHGCLKASLSNPWAISLHLPLCPVSDTDPEPCTFSATVLPHCHYLSRNLLAPTLCPPRNTFLKAANAHFKAENESLVLLVLCLDRLSLCAAKKSRLFSWFTVPVRLGFSPTLFWLTSFTCKGLLLVPTHHVPSSLILCPGSSGPSAFQGGVVF